MTNWNGNPQPPIGDPATQPSQRDPTKEYNQLRPRSLRSSGQELDEVCEYDFMKNAGIAAMEEN